MSDASDASFNRNKWTFGLGTLGRDGVYAIVAMYLIFFLTEVADLDDATLWWVSILMLATRLFDAVTDIVMGTIVDNTTTRWGPYKPWIAAGVIASAVFTMALFIDLGTGPTFVAMFFLIYLCWSLAWTMNDIPYWALLPALTIDPRQREQAGAIAKTAASIGMFAVVIAILPATKALGATFGSERAGWLAFVGIVVIALLAFQAVTLFGVREPRLASAPDHTSLRDLWRAIRGNDQLLWVALAMVAFQTGMVTTTSFGTYFFKYAYRDESMYSIFALVLAVSQLAGFISFPALARRYSRRGLYTFATGLVVAGYLVFFIAPMNMTILAVAGLLLFYGNAFIVMLMLVFLSDTIEYGQWKLGRRNTALTFAVQPFINKVGGALGTQIVALTAIWSGINTAKTPDDVTPEGLWLMKAMMLILPLALIVVGYILCRRKYTLDDATHARIVAELKERGELV